MADSLFDNRYRYDYIYPRGRSGETLRAVDTQDADRPVVIKRPAPGDAPPIRAGQEVSILNERRALSKLSGHPVLTSLLSSGQFSAGGTAHQYIVVERAEGLIIADTVLALARSGERLPELEMLIITDRLLDLLHTAHQRDIVYNDVDAKHLFWDREQYRLKVIDWGNAVFLEGDEVTPQGVSRQSDIFQVGELLYFILTGGGRPDVPRDAGEDFRVSFGADAERVPERLQAIISKAVHPNPRLRYTYINELRRDLAEYRAPLERERDGALGRLAERLRRNLSKTELQNLLATLETAAASDPGSPAARQIRSEINARLRDLEVAAGMDAAMIYLESANWSRAVEVLGELRDQASPNLAPRASLLRDCALLLADSALDVTTTPQTILDGLALIFEGRPGDAAEALLTDETSDDSVRRVEWLLAERISSHVPEVLLLRPNLYRLELALAALAAEGVPLAAPRALLDEIRALLDGITHDHNVAALRDKYRDVVDRLTALNERLATIAVQHNLSNRKLPLTTLDRALNAAMALADNMHVIGKQATTSPRDAVGALDNSRAIDPTSPAWDAIARLLDDLYHLLQSYQTFVPAADGGDLETWLRATQAQLQPFQRSLFDELLVSMTNGLNTASQAWQEYAAATLQGDRATANSALTTMIELLTTLSPTLAGWLNQLRAVVDGASYIERHAIYGGLGRALADGWEAFDRGRLADAERLGGQAGEIARSDAEQQAARRLHELARLTRDWVERGIVSNARRSEATADQVEALFTAEERKIRDNFSAQMPSKETFLRAMNKGLVEIYGRSSSAANRILLVDCVLRGTLEAHAARLDDALFWRDAAARTLGEYGIRHVAVRALDEFIERRRDINRIAALLNQVSQPGALDGLEKTRRLVEENPQAKALAGASHSLREFESALREWAEGEFRAAGLRLENALSAINDAQQAADIQVPAYRAWLERLNAAAAELHVQARAMRAAIEKRPVEPDPVIRDALHRLAQISVGVLGDKTPATLVQWRDTYERFLAAYTDPTIRRSVKLERFNELFRAMFIDRHPAYPLYRFWYEVVESAPEFPAPPTDDPTPRLKEDDDAEVVTAFVPSRYDDTGEGFTGRLTRGAQARRGVPRGLLVIGLLSVLVAGGVLVVLPALNPSGGGGLVIGGVELTLSATPPPTDAADDADAAAPTGLPVIGLGEATATLADPDSSAADLFVTPTVRVDTVASTPVASATPAPTDTPTPVPPTETPTDPPPTETPLPTLTFTPSVTPTPTASPTPTLPPGGLQGVQDALALVARLSEAEATWTLEQFAPETGAPSWRLGVGTRGADGELRIALRPALLERYYGNNAAARVRRVEAGMNLLTYDPQLPAEQVYFGLMLTSDDGARDVGVYVQVVNLNAVNIYRRVDGEITFVTQRAVNTVLTRLRIDRDTGSGAVTLYFNDSALGNPLPFVAADAPVVPALFVRDGGVILSVPRWGLTLR